MTFDQSEFEIRCEWGERGVGELASISDVVIIVDVLSFSTCVEIATRQGAVVFPYRWKDETALAFAHSIGAELANLKRTKDKYSLSPESLAQIPKGTRLVLPSPNGATLTFSVGRTPTLTGCLRNAYAVAVAARKYGPRVAVIPAGERWKNDASLRPAFEDWVGAGAIMSYLPGDLSPEASASVAAFRDIHSDIERHMWRCGSGKELIGRGFEQDVMLASQLNVSECVPTFINGAYVHKDIRRVKC
jgi:2-phosphosulfolactate phosphatase